MNKEIFTEILKLDDEVLDYYVIDPEWTVKTIMVHIVGAAYLFSQRLDGEPFSRFELKNTGTPKAVSDKYECDSNVDIKIIQMY